MKYCLIGKKLGHSYSKVIHSMQGLSYDLVEVSEDGLDEFIKSDYDGFNVTIPYKKTIIPFLDEVEESALSIGAVNTVLRKNGKLYGYNTDVFGMEFALDRAGIVIKDKKVMVLGTGGTSLTATAVCKRRGAKEVVYVSRSGELNYQNCYDEQDVEVIINTTPVGMYPEMDLSPIDLSRFNRLSGVFDCIYNPLRTNLILQAEELGVNCSNGLPMLVGQGIRAEEIWLGKEIERSRHEEVLKHLEDEKRNIVLIGMPSSGKSTVAGLLSKRLGKEVIDTDGLILEMQGRTPAEIIESEGEAKFRDIECLAVEEATKRVGVIIATGGGAVLRERNVRLLKRNGFLIYLERAVEKLIDKDRPLSKNGAISRLFEQRKPIYESACDKKVSNDGKIEDTVKEILDL